MNQTMLAAPFGVTLHADSVAAASMANAAARSGNEGMAFNGQSQSPMYVAPVVVSPAASIFSGASASAFDPMCSPVGPDASVRLAHSKRSFLCSDDIMTDKQEPAVRPMVTVLIGENAHSSQAVPVDTASPKRMCTRDGAAAAAMNFDRQDMMVSPSTDVSSMASKMDIQSYNSVPHMAFSAPPIAQPAPVQSSGGLQLMTKAELQARYKLQKLLRNSLFGQVFTAVDNACGTPVAVKVSNVAQIFSGRSLSGAKVLENPLKETEIMRRLRNHMPPTALDIYLGKAALQAQSAMGVPAGAGAAAAAAVPPQRGESSPLLEGGYPAGYKHVLRLMDECYDSENGMHWMVLEYCPNGEFFDFVVKNKHLNELTARHYFRQMLLGLMFMHSCHVCHLDFSLENLLMDDEGNLKICDFGVSRVMPENGAMFPALHHEKPGKLRYMAPEILRSQPFDGRKADMFSLGVVLFMMLAGFPPFESSGPQDARFAMASTGRLAAMLDILRVSHRFTPASVDLLSQLFCKDPSKRPSLEQVMMHPWVAN